MSSKKFLWVDMEMTGLEVETNTIIEVASIVTDFQFKELDTFHCVIQPGGSYLEKMDDWNQKTHGESGLLKLIQSEGISTQKAEEQFLQFIKKHFGAEKPIIAGNSVGHDRKFINTYFKQVANALHYRTLDVTSWKVIFKDILGKEYKKKGTHRALDDIRESIAELKYYLNYVRLDKSTSDGG